MTFTLPQVWDYEESQEGEKVIRTHPNTQGTNGQTRVWQWAENQEVWKKERDKKSV